MVIIPWINIIIIVVSSNNRVSVSCIRAIIWLSVNIYLIGYI